jgi:hypothetical protein
MMALYRKIPVVIEAIQLRWDTWNEMCDFAGVGLLADGKPEGGWIQEDPENHIVTISDKDLGRNEIGMAIPTKEGIMIARENDWVIKGVKGELYPCKPDIFAMTYEEA